MENIYPSGTRLKTTDGYEFQVDAIERVPEILHRAYCDFYMKCGKRPEYLVLGQREQAMWKCFVMLQRGKFRSTGSPFTPTTYPGMELIGSLEDSELRACRAVE